MFKKIKQSHLFNNFFGFEKNIDITNDVEVLMRKNIVIKNIVLISNIIYTIILTIISLDEKSNWFLTILCLPITYLINRALKNMIYKDKTNYLRQQIAMYICCFYMFLSAILLYTKLKMGLENTYFGEAGYILLYYSLVICSFYQSKKLLKTVYPYVIVLVTIIHFSITYNIIFNKEAIEQEFIITFFTSLEFRDIILRTFIMLAFMLVLYVSVSMSEYLQEERKKELRKRKEVENSYNKVVTDIFNITLKMRPRTKIELSDGRLISIMSGKLANLLGKTDEETKEIEEYANIHLTTNLSLDIPNDLTEEEKFEILKEETDLGSKVIRRLHLERKTEDIIRAHLEGANSLEFTEVMRKIEDDINSQIIMICDMYITLRSARTYKRAINHNNTIALLNDSYRIYYDQVVFERFKQFSLEFANIYDNYEEEEI